MEPQTVPIYMSVKCTRLTLRMPNFTRATHAQSSLSNFPKWDSNFGEPTHSRGTTDSDEIFQLLPKIKYQTHTLFDIHGNSNNIDTIYIKTQVFRLLRYYSPAPRNIARSDWATQNITHNMTSSKT